MFNLPTIPTDSLYKFLFVGGLILIIAAFTFSDRRINSLKNDAVHQKVDSLEYVINQVTDDHTIKTNFILTTTEQLAGNDTNAYKGSFLPKLYFLYRDSLNSGGRFYKMVSQLNSFATNDDPKSYVYLKTHLNEFRAMLKNLAIYEDGILMPEISDLKNKEKLYEQKDQELQDNLRVFNVYIYTAGLLGLLFALFGVIMWYLKIQRPQDENQVIQLEQLRENLDIQKTNAQLDTEIKRLQLEQMKKGTTPA
jgi:hypothetical protein